MPNTTLKSTRINLRLIEQSDLNSIHELHSLAETDEFNALGAPANVAETKSIIELIILGNGKN